MQNIYKEKKRWSIGKLVKQAQFQFLKFKRNIMSSNKAQIEDVSAEKKRSFELDLVYKKIV